MGRGVLASDTYDNNPSSSTLDTDIFSLQDSVKDVKIPAAIRKNLAQNGLDVDDSGLVNWQEGSPHHPRHWPLSKKIYDTTIIIIFEFLMTLFSNVGTVVSDHAQEQFGTARVPTIAAFTSTYLLGQAFGGILLAPVTETFGRRPSYIVSSFIYIICCIVVAVSNSIAGVIVGRFVSGLVSAIPGCVAAGSLEDLWDEHRRIWVLWLWVASAVVAIGLGPVVGVYISTSYLGWPWIFYIGAIVFAVMTAISFSLHESRTSRVITLKISAAVKGHSGCSMCSYPELHGEAVDRSPSIRTFVTEDLGRSVVMFFTEPILFAVTLMISISYGTIYLVPEAISVVYTAFGFSERQSSLVNLAISIGPILSLPTRLIDQRISTRRQNASRPLTPEDKLIGFYIAAPVLALTTWWFAWTIPPQISVSTISPFVSIAALIPIGFATSEFDYVLSGYLTDTYAAHAASANAPLAFFRATLASAFPLFGAQMFQNLGNNVAGSALAAIATGFCVVAFGFWKFGKKIREKSNFANGAAVQ